MINETETLITKSENNKTILVEDTCDKYDYLVAVGCGAIGGLIDVFLVGAPGDSTLGKWTDEQVDTVVKMFAKKQGWLPREKNKDSIASAIDFLRRKYPVNYDQRNTTDVGGAFSMMPKDHHMKSLGHSPDIIGLFFSIINQFTSTSSFISNGSIITIDTETFELVGDNFISKLLGGIANWFGHIMSDIAGDNGSRGQGKRGMGVVMPFYELLGLCDFGKFSDGKGNRQTLATIATRAYTEGYDARFGLALAIPVIMTDLSIRLIWGIRQYFMMGKDLKDCIPTSRHADLRMMILVGNGTLCVIDGLDAGIRSGGNFLAFFMRLNFIAWMKLVRLVIKEVFIRVGVNADLEEQLNAMRRVTEAIEAYLAELEKIDIEAFKKEVSAYKNCCDLIESANNEDELNAVLKTSIRQMGFELPWEGDFDSFMGDRSNKLVFE